MKRCSFKILAVIPNLYQIHFTDPTDCFDLAPLLIGKIPLKEDQYIKLYARGAAEYIELIGIDGARQWKEYIAKFIYSDIMGQLYFIVTDTRNLVINPIYDKNTNNSHITICRKISPEHNLGYDNAYEFPLNQYS
jgi:hypothetical protein